MSPVSLTGGLVLGHYSTLPVICRGISYLMGFYLAILCLVAHRMLVGCSNPLGSEYGVDPAALLAIIGSYPCLDLLTAVCKPCYLLAMLCNVNTIVATKCLPCAYVNAGVFKWILLELVSSY